MKDLGEKLNQIAYLESDPFCYGCYKVAPTGKCKTCHSDDLMRHVSGVGVEYGTEWVIKHLLAQELKAIDLDQAFEDSMTDCYSEPVQVGFLSLDPIDTMKKMDPTAWRCAKSDYESELESDDQIFSPDNGSTYYWTSDVERFIAANEKLAEFEDKEKTAQELES